MKTNINKVVTINVFSTVLLKTISAITAPIISRLLGAENYGIISVYTSCVLIIGIIFGLQTVGTFAIARGVYEEAEQNSYQASCMGLTILSYVLMTLVVLLINTVCPIINDLDNELLLLAIVQAFGTCCIGMINSKFTYEYKPTNNLIISLLVAVSVSVLSIALIYFWPNENNYYGRIYGFVIVYLIAGIIVPLYYYRVGVSFFDIKYWKFCLPLSIPIIAHSLSSVVMGNCDILMLKWLTNNKAVGIYGLAAGFSGIILTVQASLNNSWIAFYFDFLKNKKYEELYSHGKNYLFLFTGIVFGFLLISAPVYKVYASQEFWDGITLFWGFIIGYYFSFLYAFPANFEFFCQNTRVIAVSTFLAAIVNIVFNYYFISLWESLGAVIATAIANVFLYLFHHYAATHWMGTEKYPYNFCFFLPFVVALLIFGIIYPHIVDKTWLCMFLAVIDGLYLLFRIKIKKALI